MTTSKPPAPGTPPPSPPPGGPRHPTPVGPPPKFADNLMALADAVFQTPARCSPMGARSATASVRPEESGGPVDVPAVRARGEGRADGAVGAATFTLPPTPELPRFLTPAELVKAIRRAR